MHVTTCCVHKSHAFYSLFSSGGDPALFAAPLNIFWGQVEEVYRCTEIHGGFGFFSDIALSNRNVLVDQQPVKKTG